MKFASFSDAESIGKEFRFLLNISNQTRKSSGFSK